METRYTYLIILTVSLLGPLALSFDKKVAFYKKWPSVFIAILLPSIFYIAWDVYFTSKGIWSFNELYYLEELKVGNLPLEEILFFFIIPYCCLFIYKCIRVYFHNLKNKKSDDLILLLLAAALLITGIIFYQKQYTSWTFIFTAIFIFILYLNKRFFKHFCATTFILSYSVVLIPFLLINSYLTSIPIVIYNDEENLGLKILTIPLEDVFYGMLLTMMNVAIYEKLRARRKIRKHKKTIVNYSSELK